MWEVVHDMKLCLAGTYSREFLRDEIEKSKYILESFWYFKPWQIPFIKSCDLFLLDSGAFTFMNTARDNVDWDAYLNRYISFVNQYDVDHFFELDIDSIVGYEKVKQMTAKLERETGKQCIPVWHINRGKDEFIRLCEEYDYIAFGGIAIGEISKDSVIKYAPQFIKIAHQHNCKIHGLGFTDVKTFNNVRFDSVDSTTWLAGSKYGRLFHFTGNTIKSYSVPKGYKTTHYREMDSFNLRNWMKFQNYATIHL